MLKALGYVQITYGNSFDGGVDILLSVNGETDKYNVYEDQHGVSFIRYVVY